MAKKLIIICSILLNLILITYLYLKANLLTNVYSNLSFSLQNDLVQLENAIELQNNVDWKETDKVIEKIEDVNESITYLLATGKNTGLVTKSQEEDMHKLSTYFLKYYTYQDSSNTELNGDAINQLMTLGEDLKAAGWKMNTGYSGDWDSFSKKISALIK
ncbi:hypothetical protein ACFSR7_30495 [Cohnella sp. GCM10020058]|uniref:hypothetical protein n=1 Tax=Cohnella sp. GCM10020058 TaxID=3317330 RepID=UPI00362A0FC5